MSKALDIEAFVQAAADAIIAAGADGKIVFWNSAAARIFGFTADEALGQSLDLIIPERFRARHWTGYRQVISTGKTKYQSEVLRVPAQHKKGQPLSIAFTVTLLDAPGGGTVIVAIVREETARWNEERDLKRRLAELEQRGRKAPADAARSIRARGQELCLPRFAIAGAIFYIPANSLTKGDDMGNVQPGILAPVPRLARYRSLQKAASTQARR